MAALNYVNGPDGKGFPGYIDLGGFSCNTFDGRFTFNGTDATATLKIRGGGQTQIRMLLVHYNVADHTVSWAISGDTITFTRVDTTSGAEISLLIFFN